MRNFADRLLDAIDDRKNPSVVGLDPRLENIPDFLKEKQIKKFGNDFKAVANTFLEFNKRIIDAVKDIVPAVKPQMAFYEKYGHHGVKAFEDTVNYAKKKGLIVIEDAKRNDIGSTALAYAEGHLGEVTLFNDKRLGFDVDCITVNPYLGFDSISPFIKAASDYGKGIFILVKTSNPSSVDLQDLESKGIKIYEIIANLVDKWGEGSEGDRGYKSVGAVIGATYPEEANKLRKLMPSTLFLVPGYGAQGGGASDIVPCFNEDGYGAIVNSSRGIIFAYQEEKYNEFSPEKFDRASMEAAKAMREDIITALKNGKKLPHRW